MRDAVTGATTSAGRIRTPADLVEMLQAAAGDVGALQGIFGRIGFGAGAVEEYCHFDSRHYTRNLIARTDDFELLALCWEPGQITPIHDHAGSDGWVHCLRGEIEEVRFHVFPSESGEPRVERGESVRASAGSMTHINDDIAWHTVANPTAERATSLHLYAGPIESCRYFDPDTRRIRVRRLDYYTVGGRRNRVNQGFFSREPVRSSGGRSA